MLDKIKSEFFSVLNDKFSFNKVKSAIWLVLAIVALKSANEHAQNITHALKEQSAATKNVVIQLEKANKVLANLDRIIDYNGIKIKPNQNAW